MLANIPLHDFKNFKPDVVICPHCTQHLMGVRDIRWAADKVEFSYGCDGCGHELDKAVAEAAAPDTAAAPDHIVEAPPQKMAATAEEDIALFPFRPEPAKAAPAEPETPPEVLPVRRKAAAYTPRHPFIEDRAARSPREVFDAGHAAPAQDTPTVASRASVLLRDVTIFNL